MPRTLNAETANSGNRQFGRRSPSLAAGASPPSLELLLDSCTETDLAAWIPAMILRAEGTRLGAGSSKIGGFFSLLPPRKHPDTFSPSAPLQHSYAVLQP